MTMCQKFMDIEEYSPYKNNISRLSCDEYIITNKLFHRKKFKLCFDYEKSRYDYVNLFDSIVYDLDIDAIDKSIYSIILIMAGVDHNYKLTVWTDIRNFPSCLFSEISTCDSSTKIEDQTNLTLEITPYVHAPKTGDNLSIIMCKSIVKLFAAPDFSVQFYQNYVDELIRDNIVTMEKSINSFAKISNNKNITYTDIVYIYLGNKKIWLPGHTRQPTIDLNDILLYDISYPDIDLSKLNNLHSKNNYDKNTYDNLKLQDLYNMDCASLVNFC